MRLHLRPICSPRLCLIVAFQCEPNRLRSKFARANFMTYLHHMQWKRTEGWNSVDYAAATKTLTNIFRHVSQVPIFQSAMASSTHKKATGYFNIDFVEEIVHAYTRFLTANSCFRANFGKVCNELRAVWATRRPNISSLIIFYWLPNM